MPAAASTKPARTCQWLVKPYDLPTGGRLGFLRMTVGGRSDFYRVSWVQQSEDMTVFEVSKEREDGSFSQPYTVVLSNPGVSGWSSCDCPAGQYRGGCRHVLSLRAATAALLR